MRGERCTTATARRGALPPQIGQASEASIVSSSSRRTLS
jgi:hypothetical protein